MGGQCPEVLDIEGEDGTSWFGHGDYHRIYGRATTGPTSNYTRPARQFLVRAVDHDTSLQEPVDYSVCVLATRQAFHQNE